MHRKILLACLVTSVLAGKAGATMINYNDFSSASGLTLTGTTGTTSTAADGNVLRLVGTSSFQAGNAFGTNTINATTFSTEFQFRMTNPGGISDSSGQVGADGLTFIVQSVSSSAGGAGYGAGYAGINKSVGIKFDTFQNGDLGDPSSNFLGIYTNGNVQTTPGTPTVNITPNFDDGNLWTAWVDYNGTTLSVRADESGQRPSDALLSENLDLSSILGQDTAYVGFGAATGSAWENVDIKDWQYDDTYDPITSVPEPGSLASLGAGLIGLGLTLLRRKKRSLVLTD